jgi:hypothetical protein
MINPNFCLEIYDYKLENYTKGELPNNYEYKTLFLKKHDNLDVSCGKVVVNKVVNKVKNTSSFKLPSSALNDSEDEYEDDDGYEYEEYDEINHDFIKSCDYLDSVMIKSTNEDMPKKEESIIDDSINFIIKHGNLEITANDLVNFIYYYGAKRKTLKNFMAHYELNEELNSMRNLYNPDIIDTILDDFKNIQINNLKEEFENEDILSFVKEDGSYIKYINQDNKDFVIIGDIHGSIQTLIRLLFRFRHLNILDHELKTLGNYHIIFLGDIVDRGLYSYESIMIIWLLQIFNSNTVHINRGNHEEIVMNGSPSYVNLQTEMIMRKIHPKFYDIINEYMKYQHSAMIINLGNDEYTFLAHGGLPTQIDLVNNSPDDQYKIINISRQLKNCIYNKKSIILSQSEGYGARWNDFYGKKISQINKMRGIGTIIGLDLIQMAYDIGIKFIIRAHQDNMFNSKMIIKTTSYNEFIDIKQIHNDYNKYICDGPIRKINLEDDGIMSIPIINDIQAEKNKSLLPLLVISTNTNSGRDLTSDSFVILKKNCQKLKCKFDVQLGGNIYYKLDKYEFKMKNTNKTIYNKKYKYYLKKLKQIGGFRCPICFRSGDDIKETNKNNIFVKLNPCHHIYCQDCALNIIHHNNICALCREPINTQVPYLTFKYNDDDKYNNDDNYLESDTKIARECVYNDRIKRQQNIIFEEEEKERRNLQMQENEEYYNLLRQIDIERHNLQSRSDYHNSQRHRGENINLRFQNNDRNIINEIFEYYNNKLNNINYINDNNIKYDELNKILGSFIQNVTNNLINLYYNQKIEILDNMLEQYNDLREYYRIHTYENRLNDIDRIIEMLNNYINNMA